MLQQGYAARAPTERAAGTERGGGDLSTEDEGLLAVLRGLRRNLLLLLLVALPIVAGVTAFAESRPSSYTAESTLSFTPRLGSSVGADVIRLVLPRYVAYLAAPTTLGRVGNATGEDPDRLASAADASIQTDTANLTITVTLADGGQAADVANAFADAALVYARSDDLLEAQLVARALPSDQPSGPPRRLLEIAGILAAVLTAVAVALVRERLRPRVLTAADLAQVSGLTVLGRVPSSAQLQRGETVEVTDPLLGPAVRATWLALERASREVPATLLAVTSPGASNGKTTLVTALGAAAARSGRRVLLVDGDTQRAGLTLALGPFRGPGLVEALRGAAAADSLHEGPVDGVRVLPAGDRTIDASELSRSLPALLGQLVPVADLLLLDCPPLQDEDARGVVAAADAVLLVVAAGTSRQDVVDALEVLDALELRVIGAVLNGGRPATRPSDYQRPSIVDGGG